MRIIWLDALRHGLQVLAFCCVVAVFTTLVWPSGGYPRQLVYSVCIGGLTWLVIEFGRLLVPREHCHRNPERQGHGWPRGWRGLLLTAIGITVGFFAGTRLAAWLLGDTAHMPQRDLRMALVVTIAAGVVASFYFHTRGRQAALQAHIASAERDAALARLMLLQSQLEPHMLFNTLANLRVLIGLDPAAAQQMLDRLGDYLRATLGGSRAALHPLADEFERLRDYLELIAVRMGPRLAWRLDLPDALRSAKLPPLLLQPLVENAIRHGLEPEVAGGSVQVSARTTADGSRLALQVRNSGTPLTTPLPQTDARLGRSFGLAQVRERLQTLYGDQATFELIADSAGQTCANIVIPLQ
ncbi:sensor histidine kinase [Comamonas badia]|uniref:sensor histidine kinase n=1 Tax=Comamonas badia TaxID=265291 RepID=UPI000408DC21|nr:histidine kinase [Comamonas badia]